MFENLNSVEMMNFICEIDWKVVTNIIIALIAGTVALLQVKGNIISSARIKWIEDLRETISSYITGIVPSMLYLENMKLKREKLVEDGIDPTENDDFKENYYKPYTEHVKKQEKLQYKIILYLNTKNKDQNQLESIFAKINNLLAKNLNNSHGMSEEQFQNTVDELTLQLINFSRDIFNKEYKKSKRIWKL